MSNNNVITLTKTNEGYNATYSGDCHAMILELFGTDTLATAYTQNANPYYVLNMIQTANPEAKVELHESVRQFSLFPNNYNSFSFTDSFIGYMMKDRFKNQDGSLTVYALRCGYIQRVDLVTPDKEDVSLELYHEGCVYQVRAHDHTNGYRLVWNSYDDTRLTEAKENFRTLKRNIKSGFISYKSMQAIEKKLEKTGYQLQNERVQIMRDIETFKATLSQVAPDGCPFKVGDKVNYMNDYGVVFHDRIIIGFDDNPKTNQIAKYGHCVFLDNDSYWYPVTPESLTKEQYHVRKQKISTQYTLT